MSRVRQAIRKIIIPLMMLALFLAFHQEAAAQDTGERVYVIGTDTTYAPFEFVNTEGELVGIDMDLLEAIAKNQGFEYEVRVLGFNAAVQALESNQVDGVIAGMSITDERREAFDFSDPYYSSGSQFAVSADSDIEYFEDLEGQTVAVKTGTTGYDVASELSEQYGFSLNIFEDSVNMYEDLQVGNSQAVVEDYPVMVYANSTGRVDLKFIEEQQAVADNGFAVNKGENRELLQMFNDGLANIRASGEYDEIISRYLSEEALSEQGGSGNIFTQFIGNAEPLLRGLWNTIWLTFISFFIAMILGVLVGLMRISDVTLLEGISQIFIDIMRGTPLIVLAFFVYFGIPQMTGLQFEANIAGIITLSLNATAYIAEIVRGGIQAVDEGQMEAGRSLGLPRWTTMKRVILPQATQIALPSFINQFVITMKDTSILSVIGIVELTQTGKIIIARTYDSGNVWLIVGAMYIILITILTRISGRLEKEL